MPPASVANNVEVKEPIVFGVPESTPVSEFRLKPLGNVPLLTLNDAPLAANVHVYALLTWPAVADMFEKAGSSNVSTDGEAPPPVFCAKASEPNVRTPAGIVTEGI